MHRFVLQARTFCAAASSQQKMTHKRSAIAVRPVQSQQQLKEFRSVTAAYLVGAEGDWGFVFAAYGLFWALVASKMIGLIH